MPVERCTLPEGAQGWRWGKHGHCYAERADAERQGAAAHANGYTGDAIGHQRLAFDRASVRTYDHDGRLHVEVTNLSKANICPYLGSEIPDGETLGLDPGRVYRLLRDPDELTRGAPTFDGIPLIDAFDETGREHIQVSAAAPRKEIVVGSTGNRAAFEAPYLRNSLVVWDAKAIQGIEDGTRREISSAYYYRADMTPGSYGGEPYDGVMRDIRGNHVALVRAGRAGSDVAVGDSALHVLETHIMGKTLQPVKLSRKATLARGALLAHFQPLAADSRQAISAALNPVLAGITRANWAKGKPALISALRPKLAGDADIGNLVALLDSLDDEGNEDDDVAIDQPTPVTAVNTTQDADPLDEILEALRGKLSDEDLAAVESKLRGLKLAGDEDDDDTAALDAPPATPGTPAPPATSAASASAKDTDDQVTRQAMDAAIARARKDTRVAMDAAMREAISQATRQAARDAENAAIRRMRAVADAEAFVLPWVGHLALAQDSAEGVYRAALETLGVGIDGVHPSAYRAILEAQPKAGMQRSRVAMDAAAIRSFAERYPHASAIRQLG